MNLCIVFFATNLSNTTITIAIPKAPLQSILHSFCVWKPTNGPLHIRPLKISKWSMIDKSIALFRRYISNIDAFLQYFILNEDEIEWYNWNFVIILTIWKHLFYTYSFANVDAPYCFLLGSTVGESVPVPAVPNFQPSFPAFGAGVPVR